MNEEDELPLRFSTYRLLTAQRLLSILGIHLTNQELVQTTLNKNCIYHQFIKVALKNILNGIILEQARDYQLYVQKLFIDYLLSSEGGKTEDLPGADIRAALEEGRQDLITQGEEFTKLQNEHSALIADSQRSLLPLAEKFENSLYELSLQFRKCLGAEVVSVQDALKAVRSLILNYDEREVQLFAVESVVWEKMFADLNLPVKQAQSQALADLFTSLNFPRAEIDEVVSADLGNSKGIGIQLCAIRAEFYNAILKTTELIAVLPDYKIDPIKDGENRGSIVFNNGIGVT